MVNRATRYYDEREVKIYPHASLVSALDGNGWQALGYSHPTPRKMQYVQPERSLAGSQRRTGQNGDEEKQHNARSEICSYENAWSPSTRSYVMWNVIETSVAERKFWHPPCCRERSYPLGLRTGRGDM